MKISPVGNKILIKPLNKENFKTEGNIELAENELKHGEVIETSNDLKDEKGELLYPIGCTVIYAGGAGISEYYKGQVCMWLINSDIWGIKTND